MIREVSHVCCTVASYSVFTGWMTGDFMSFTTVFQSNQADGPMIMKGCTQWNPIYS